MILNKNAPVYKITCCFVLIEKINSIEWLVRTLYAYKMLNNIVIIRLNKQIVIYCDWEWFFLWFSVAINLQVFFSNENRILLFFLIKGKNTNVTDIHHSINWGSGALTSLQISDWKGDSLPNLHQLDSCWNKAFW